MPLKDLFIFPWQNSPWLQWSKGLQGLHPPKYDKRQTEQVTEILYTPKMQADFAPTPVLILIPVLQMIASGQRSKSKQLPSGTWELVPAHLLPFLLPLGEHFMSPWGQVNGHTYNQSLHLTWQAVTFNAVCKPRNMPHVKCQSKNTFHSAHLGSLKSSSPASLKCPLCKPNKMVQKWLQEYKTGKSSMAY